MQCGDVRYGTTTSQRKMHVISMKMDDVELGCSLKHAFEHQNLVSKMIHAVLVGAQRAPTDGHQMRLGHRIRTGKKGHLMPLSHKLLGEV